jgi:hypothetical protein
LPGATQSPANQVASEVVCELVTDFPLSDSLKKYLRPKEPFEAGILDLRFIDLADAENPSPGASAKLLCQQLDERLQANLQPPPDDEFEWEDGRSTQKFRYQTVIDGVSVSASRLDFTVWSPHNDGKLAADVRGQIYRPVSYGPKGTLLDAQTALERSGAMKRLTSPEPIKRIYLRYLSTCFASRVYGGPVPRITVRPVWEFLSDYHVLGDMATRQQILVDALAGVEFQQHAADAECLVRDPAGALAKSLPPDLRVLQVSKGAELYAQSRTNECYKDAPWEIEIGPAAGGSPTGRKYTAKLWIAPMQINGGQVAPGIAGEMGRRYRSLSDGSIYAWGDEKQIQAALDVLVRRSMNEMSSATQAAASAPATTAASRFLRQIRMALTKL